MKRETDIVPFSEREGRLLIVMNQFWILVRLFVHLGQVSGSLLLVKYINQEERLWNMRYLVYFILPW